MPNPMKKPMPGGGMVPPMRMEMGHGGDMERAVKIYLMKKGGKTAFPDLTGDGKVTFADILKGRLRKGKKKSQAYGGKVMREGGEVEYGMGGKTMEYGMGGKTMEYGIGGAVMGGLNALMQGKGLAGAAGAAARGFVTPGSGIAQGAQLAGNLAQRSNNPMLQNIGKMTGMASNFLPGGNPMGGLRNLAGMFQARGGMMVPPKVRLLRR